VDKQNISGYDRLAKLAPSKFQFRLNCCSKLPVRAGSFTIGRKPANAQIILQSQVLNWKTYQVF
jgi:hypothetical protein